MRITRAPFVCEVNQWIVFHIYAAVCYILLLRGRKVCCLIWKDCKGIVGAGNGSYVVEALQGIIKGETNHRHHLLMCVPVTLSVVDMKLSLGKD
jgi:hypothetical protein